MRYFRKLKFNQKELGELLNRLDGYIWGVVDTRRNVLSAGDDFVADMRDELLVHRSKLEDIFGFGLDLKTGEIDFLNSCNRRNPTVGCDGRISEERQRRIESMVHYFFDELAPYAAERRRPRYSRKPINTGAMG